MATISIRRERVRLEEFSRVREGQLSPVKAGELLKLPKTTSTMEVSSNTNRSPFSGLSWCHRNSPVAGSNSSRRCTVLAVRWVVSASRLVARPVGAASTHLSFLAEKISKMLRTSVVLPTPGPPVIPAPCADRLGEWLPAGLPPAESPAAARPRAGPCPHRSEGADAAWQRQSAQSIEPSRLRLDKVRPSRASFLPGPPLGSDCGPEQPPSRLARRPAGRSQPA